MVQGERSTADSPLKDQMEEQQHNSPRVEMHATEDGVSDKCQKVIDFDV
jgi:hypothetical protein